MHCARKLASPTCPSCPAGTHLPGSWVSHLKQVKLVALALPSLSYYQGKTETRCWLGLAPLQVPGGSRNSQTLLDGEHPPRQCRLLSPCLPQEGATFAGDKSQGPAPPGALLQRLESSRRCSQPSARSTAARRLRDTVPSAVSQTLGYLHASPLPRHLRLTIKLQTVPLLAPCDRRACFTVRHHSTDPLSPPQKPSATKGMGSLLHPPKTFPIPPLTASPPSAQPLHPDITMFGAT